MFKNKKFEKYINRLLFEKNSALLKIKMNERKSRENLFLKKYILRKMIRRLIIILFSIICIVILDYTLLTNNHYLSLNNGDLLNYVIGGIGVAGIFLGLYSSNVMSIYSTKYVDAPERIRKLFELERTTASIINTITGYLFSCIVALVLLILKVKLGIIYIAYLTIYTLFILVSYTELGNSSLHLVESFNLANVPINNLNNIFSVLMSGKGNFKKDISIQNHLSVMAEKNIEDLKIITEYNINSTDKTNKSANDFTIKLLALLLSYWKVVDKIEYDSKWFKEKSYYPKWHTEGNTTISLHFSSKTHLNKKTEINRFWLEDELLDIQKSIITYFAKCGDIDSIINFLVSLSSVIDSIESIDRLEIIVRLLQEIQTDIERAVCINTENKYDDKIVGMVELYSRAITNVLLKSKKIFESIDYNEIYSDFKNKNKYYFIINNKRYRELFKGIEVETKLEKQQITKKEFVIQQIEKDLENQYKNFLNGDAFDICASNIYLGKKFFDQRYFFESYIIFNNLSIFADELEKIFTGNSNMSSKVKENLDTINNYLIQNSLEVFEEVDKLKIDFPDVIGYLYNNYVEKIFNIIMNDELDLFKEELSKFYFITNYQEKNIRKTKTNFNDYYNAKVTISPVIEYMTICGYACLWGDLVQNEEWKKTVEKVLDDSDSKECIRQISICDIEKKVGKVPGILYRDFISYNFERVFFNKVENEKLLNVSIIDHYGQVEIVTENMVLKNFINIRQYSNKNNISVEPLYEYYAVSILNNKVDERDRYVTKNGWDEKN